MTKVKEFTGAVSVYTGQVEGQYLNSKLNSTVSEISAGTEYAVASTGKAALLTLSKAWIGIGLVKPATTVRKSENDATIQTLSRKGVNDRIEGHSRASLDRFDYEKLFSLQLGEYFMPLSQTFNLRSRKRLNVSSLVAGIDIIQETRKEAKTIECNIRIGLREEQTNLQIVRGGNKNTETIKIVDGRPVSQTGQEVVKLAEFLQELYENDTVFIINNDMINNTFGVTHVIMSEYKFMPKVGMGSYSFEFSLTEVKYGDNVLTFDLTQLNSTADTLTGE